MALKNQRRNEKIVANPSIVQSTGASTRENDRYQRLRVNSGVPFLRAGTGNGAGGGDFRGQRNNSNLSRGGTTTTTNGRLSTMINSSNKKMQSTKSQSFLKQDTNKKASSKVHARDSSVNSQNSNGMEGGGLITNGLRNHKEFVNHKILDCMGDLYLAGYKIIGKIVCSQGGHKLTNQLLRKVFENDENFSLIEIKEKSLPHAFVNKTSLRSIA